MWVPWEACKRFTHKLARIYTMVEARVQSVVRNWEPNIISQTYEMQFVLCSILVHRELQSNAEDASDHCTHPNDISMPNKVCLCDMSWR